LTVQQSQGSSEGEKNLRKAVGFGLTSGVITNLGVMIGLHSGTRSKLAVLVGTVVLAISDALSVNFVTKVFSPSIVIPVWIMNVKIIRACQRFVMEPQWVV
jgi:hypothetical protein